MNVEPPLPPPPPVPAPPPALEMHCTLCDAGLEAGHDRCHACGLHQVLGPDKPNPFVNKSLWLLIGAMLAVYLVVLGVVAILPPQK